MATKQVSETGKSFDDYRNIIKTLKVRLKNLQDRNGEVEEKITQYEAFLARHPDLNEKFKNGQLAKKEKPDEKTKKLDYSTNEALMQKFFYSSQKLGLTLEMLFRAADTERKGAILLDDFRIFLGQVKLGLTHAEITRILYVLDEDCSGTIKFSEYKEVLAAYGVNSERIGDASKSLKHETLIKFVDALIQDGITDEKALMKCDPAKKGEITAKSLGDFYKSLSGDVSEKEKAALFSNFDFEGKGTVSQDQFLQVMKRARSSRQQGSEGMARVKEFNFQEAMNETVGDNAMNIANMNFSTIDKPTIKKNAIKSINKFEQSYDIPFTKVLENILQNLNEPERGILLHHLIDACSPYKEKLTVEEVFNIFHYMDDNENGHLDTHEIVDFYHEIKTPESSPVILLLNFVKILEGRHITIRDYFAENNIDESEEFNLSAFNSKVGSLLGANKEEAEKLFKFFDTDNSGFVTFEEVVSKLREYRGDIPLDVVNREKAKSAADKAASKGLGVQTRRDSLANISKSKKNPNTMTLTKVSNFKNLSTDDQKFFSLLKSMKPAVSEEDYLLVDGKRKKEIFVDPLAVLYKAYQIINEIKGTGQRWRDHTFGPSESDPNGLSAMYFFANTIPAGCPDPETIKWATLEECAGDKPPVFFDKQGMSANEVLQSDFLGDCWFISALSVIATHDEFIRGAFEPTEEAVKEIDDQEVMKMMIGIYTPIFHFLRNFGIYVFRFFKNYQWVYVMVDETLPVLPNGQILYGKCRPAPEDLNSNEFWVPLIEKAYAKIHNCYQALFSGYIDEALADMTGHASEKRDILDSQLQTPEQKDKLWNQLMFSLENKCMMGCSADGGTETNIMVDEEDTGLKSGHAYALINLLELPCDECTNYHKSHRLVRVRNPWGYGEWQLKWSERGDEKQKLKKHLDQIQKYFDNLKAKGHEVEEFDPEADDGTFIMCYKDWRKVFDNLFVSIKFPESWSGRRARSEWTERTSGGFPLKRTPEQFASYAKNPQYLIDLKNSSGNKTEFFITVGQVDGRLIRGYKYPFKEVVHPFSVCLFKLENGESKLEKF